MDETREERIERLTRAFKELLEERFDVPGHPCPGTISPRCFGNLLSKPAYSSSTN